MLHLLSHSHSKCHALATKTSDTLSVSGSRKFIRDAARFQICRHVLGGLSRVAIREFSYVVEVANHGIEMKIRLRPLFSKKISQEEFEIFLIQSLHR